MNWPHRKLGCICLKITDGSHNPPKGVELSEYMMLSSKNVFDDNINLNKPRFLSKDDFEKENKRTDVCSSDVLLTIVGTVGRVAVVTPDLPKFTLQRSVAVLKPDIETILPRFLMLSLQNILDMLMDGARGVAQKGIYLKTLREISISLPPINEQKRIVAILDLAFADIEKARDYAEQNLKNARELFESYLQQVFSQRGDGWVLTDIGNLVDQEILAKPLDGNHGDIHPKRSDYVENGIPFIMASDINFGLVDTKSCKFISRSLADSLRKGFAKNGDILLSHKATIGRSAILRTTLDYVMLTPQVTYYRVLNSEKTINTYVYWYFNSPDFLRGMNEYAGVGSTRAYIGITKQLKLKFCYPSIDRQTKIVSKLESLSVEIVRLEKIYNKKLKALNELKKSILQKAFTGKLTKEKVA